MVVDSGFLIASFMEEPYSETAKRLLSEWQTQGLQIAAPTLLRYEMFAVIRKFVFLNRLQQIEAENGLNWFFSLSIEYSIDDSLLRRSFELATQFNLPRTYDAQYLALAERLQCEF